MSRILRLEKTLSERPECNAIPDVTIRAFNGDDDVAAWLQLREAAFAELIAKGRPWTPRDFQREFAGKRLWFAEQTPGGSPGAKWAVVGAVALGRKSSTVEWLMVDPAYRRRGIGAQLLTTVEQAAWDCDVRKLSLETHVNWRDAVQLYERCGYKLM